MAKVGLFFDTQTGNTEEIAERIQSELGGDSVVDLQSIGDVEVSAIAEYDNIIIGSPTWDMGEMPGGWDGVYEDLDELDLSGKKVAFFGLGDQVGYSDNYLDAMGNLAAKITGCGASAVADRVCAESDYEHDASTAVKDGYFVGLALDLDNQPDETDARIQAWIEQVKSAFGL
ncbi:MAG: flavodoxin [Geitlerinemataceae cyanobacterium]